MHLFRARAPRAERADRRLGALYEVPSAVKELFEYLGCPATTLALRNLLSTGFLIAPRDPRRAWNGTGSDTSPWKIADRRVDPLDRTEVGFVLKGR